MKQVDEVSGVVDDSKAIGGATGVKHSVASLDGGAHCYRRGPLEYALRSFVVAIPMLVSIVEEHLHADKIHYMLVRRLRREEI